jgi:hypothetical protein
MVDRNSTGADWYSGRHRHDSFFVTFESFVTHEKIHVLTRAWISPGADGQRANQYVPNSHASQL